MNDDAELLSRFANEKSEDAFAELVRRKIDLVYAAALRQTGGDSHLAEDVTQAVFLTLAQQADKLSRHAVLTGWLYTTVRFLALKALRAKVRWHRRETEANMMNLDAGECETTWTELRPVIDEAMSALADTDRVAVLLRYFEARPLVEVGAALGVSENAARMRVERALEKLRRQLARRGITSTAAALGGALVAQPVVSAPAGLAASVAGASLAGVAAMGSLVGFMSTTKVGLGIVAVAVLGTGAYFTGHYRSATEADLREAEFAALRLENQRLVAGSRVANAENAGRLRRQTEGANDGAENGSDEKSGISSSARPSAALQMLVDFKKRGVVDAGITLVDRKGKLSRAFAELFNLTPGEEKALQQSVDRTLDQLAELERANATISHDDQGGIVIDVQSFAKAGGKAYDELMKSFADTLGPERNAAYLALGATQVERALGQFGAPKRKLTFSTKAVATDGRKYSVQEKYKLPEETGSRSADFKTVRELSDYVGTVGRLLPSDFGQ